MKAAFPPFLISSNPGRLTSFLQPLDVSLNKLFKDGVGRRWIQGMTGGIHEFIVDWWPKEVIVLWISGAWSKR